MKSRRLVLILVLGLPLAVLFIIELVARAGADADGPLPPQEAKLVNDIPGFKREVVWKSDSLGLRRIEGSGSAPLVLCLGGSDTHPMLQSDADSWWGRMQQNLKAKGREVRVAAGGPPGGESGGCARWLMSLLPHLDPDVVVLAVGQGEVLSRPPGYVYDPSALNQSVFWEPAGWKGTVLDISAMARAYRRQRQEAAAKERLAPLEVENAVRNNLDEDKARFQKATPIEMPWRNDPGTELSGVIKRLSEVGEEEGFQLVVVWMPWPHRPEMGRDDLEDFRFALEAQGAKGKALITADPRWVDGRMRAFRVRARAVAEGLGIPFIDAAASVDGAAEGIYHGDLQLTDAGASAVGKVVAEKLAPLLP